jgi:hypothetical protein
MSTHPLTALNSPSWTRTLALCLLLGLSLCACVAGGGSGSDEPSKTTDATNGSDAAQPTTDWNAEMSLDELLAVASSLGISFDGNPTKDEVVAALEEKTGCGCFGAICGTGQCGHFCGSCPGSAFCFSGACEDEASCPSPPLESTGQMAQTQEEEGKINFTYESVLSGADYNLVRIRSKNVSATDLPGPGTYDIAQFDPDTCTLCVTLHNGCNSTSCKENWVARGGFVEFDGTLMQTNVAGRLFEMKFEEVSEGADGKFDLLDDGRDRCVSFFEFEATNDVSVIDPDACSPQGTGKTIGSQIGNFTLQNCLGESVSLHDHCGKKAIWVVGAAGW